MKHLSLFSGSGIGTLAALHAGIVTVAHAENDPACWYLDCMEPWRDVKYERPERCNRPSRSDHFNLTGGFIVAAFNPNKPHLNCATCGTPFRPTNPRQRCCSVKCGMAHRKNRVTLICPNCHKPFDVPVSTARKGRVTCSNKCRYEYKTGSRGPNGGGGAWMRGERNPNWRGGVSEDRHEMHCRDARVHNWRREVLSRDKKTCQRCGVKRNTRKRVEVIAHHQKAWADFPESRFDVANGVTLCTGCHKWVHGKANTAKEFIEC